MKRLLALLVIGFLATVPVYSQERTLAQVKQDIRNRVAGDAAPFDGLQKTEVDQILESITSLDPEPWGKLWCDMGLRHEARGDELLKQRAPAKQIGDEYYLAYG